MACLSEDSILEFLSGATEAVARVEEHIDTCAACRALVSEVAKSSLVASHGPAYLDDDPTAPDGPVEAAIPGTVLAGRFRILESLGRGSMGRVFRAEDLSLKIDVSIKVLHPEVSEVPAYVRQLHHEILTGRRVSHPNVRRIFDLGEAEGRYFISMEYIDGETLTSRIARDPPGTAEAVNILTQIRQALEAAHREEVVHRDLKLSNVMLDWAGQVKVMDFGLARMSRDVSVAGLVGTPAYWSPEQSRGEPATPQSDSYGLGVIMCDLLCGESRGLESRSLAGKAPRAFRYVIRKCLAPSPEDRYPNAARVELALWRAARLNRRLRRAGLLAATAALAGAMVLSVHLLTQPDGSEETVELGPQTASRALSEEPVVAEAPAGTEASRPNRKMRAKRSPAKRASGRPTGVSRASAREERGADPVGKTESGAETGVASDAAAKASAGLAAPEASAEMEIPRLEGRLEAAERLRAQRGILPEDVAGYEIARRSARAAVSGRRLDDTRESVERLEALLAKTAIDEKFVNQKLARISKLSKERRVTEPRAKAIAATLSRVHEAFFAGDYQRANAHLNQMWRLLEAAD